MQRLLSPLTAPGESVLSQRRRRRTLSAAAASVTSTAAAAAAEPLTAPTVHSWRWRGHEVHFQSSGDSGPPLVLLPGFGVGAFHYRAQLDELSAKHRVFAIDLLGQGESWPAETEGLAFGPELWADQVRDFIDQVVGEPAFVAGNSLGGYVATLLAATTPDRVRGVILFNASPFWSSAPNPVTEPERAERMPWDGKLPAPWFVRLLLSLWWRMLRTPAVLRALLSMVYADSSAVDDTLIHNILKPTKRKGAADIFCSVFFSPRTELSFNDMLDRCRENRTPLLLLYGEQDPWVVPLWGQRLKRRVPDAVYLELQNSGHCPHHETPAAVNAMVASFIEATVSGGKMAQLPPLGESWTEPQSGIRVTHCTGEPRTAFEKADAAAAARVEKLLTKELEE